MITHADISPEAIKHLVQNMREIDRREVYALRWNDDEDALITTLLAFAGDLWRVWLLDGVPVAVNGATPIRPGVAGASAFGTDDFWRVVVPMTRWSINWLIPALARSGYHRGEAYVAANNTRSIRWMSILGATQEAYLHGYGRDQEDYRLYTWRLDEHVLFRRRRWGRRWGSSGAILLRPGDRAELRG